MSQPFLQRVSVTLSFALNSSSSSNAQAGTKKRKGQRGNVRNVVALVKSVFCLNMYIR